jgi:hypothetical protein
MVAVSDAARRTEIETMMRTDGGEGYWSDPGFQREYGEVLAPEKEDEAPPLCMPHFLLTFGDSSKHRRCFRRA